MNQTFNLSRWTKLVILHWAGNRKRYLLAVPAIGGLLLAWFSFVIIMDHSNPMDTIFQYSSYYCGLFFVGCLYASTIFSELSNQPQGIGYLSVPASHFEKLLCGLLFSVVLFFIIFTTVFYLVDIPMVGLANHVIEQQHYTYDGSGVPVDHVFVYNVLPGVGGPPADILYHLLLLSYFAIQSVFVLGSVYFSRYAFLKTTVAVLLFIFGYMVFEMKILQNTLPAGWDIDLFTSWRQQPNAGEIHYVNLSSWVSGIIVFLLKYSIPLIFWVVAYFRLKEKEV